MNTNQLKKFAQETRRKLLKQVNGKLEHVLSSDNGALRDKAHVLKDLKKDLDRLGRETLVDKVAYTWFNRFVALRYMDVRGFQPLEMSILSPQEGQVSPQILQEAMAGHIPDELKVDRQQIMDILDGRTASSNPENEAYRQLLVASCNHLHSIFPFLFESIDDYTELLLPDDLTSEFSIIHDVIKGMTEEDCEQVEILGWLYQFYISEKNYELISSKKKYKKEDLAPASQLFTPKWIVQYMVDNTLGQIWSEINPNTSILSELEFYIKPAYEEQLVDRERKSVEEVTFFEPCVGSGHILSYAFDVFYKMYEEMGYNPSDIPTLILTKNLFGVDIDQRATQIAGFVLMMKAREKSRRFFRKQVQPNVYYYEDFKDDEKFKNATTLGSLVQVASEEYKAISVDGDSIFGHQKQKLKDLYKLLGQSYDVVVTNPPYIGSKRMEPSLKKYVNEHYEDTKSDLFATFVIRCLEMSNERGMTGYMTPFVWMFISSYQNLREEVIDNHFINNLIQLEYSGFDGATVPVCTFTLRNEYLEHCEGSYIRLSDFKGAKVQAPKTLEAIKNTDFGWFYTADQKDFEKIPGSPIGYWVSNYEFELYTKDNLIKNYSHPAKGIDTGENAFFLRYWYEIPNILFDKNDAKGDWVPYNKGGAFKRWYGNREYALRWHGDGKKLKSRLSWKKRKPTLRNKKHWFKEGFTWTTISSGGFSARYCEKGALFDNGGCTLFTDENLMIFGALLNSKISDRYLEFLSPTLNFQPGDIGSIALHPDYLKANQKMDVIKICIEVAKNDWNSRETSWDFEKNELIRFNKEGGIETIEEATDLYKQYWTNKFIQLHENEEELNRQFIDIYGLQDELTPVVPLNEITILQEELDSKKLKKIDKQWRGNSNGTKPALPFKDKEVFAQFVSYAVGCMFGRYSLDKEGLILANQGETLEDYLEKVELSKQDVSFLPDKDNIIPVLDDEWFEDDIVTRFHQFLKASFGEEHFQKNISFVEEQLGNNLRKYFTKDFYKDHYKRYNKRPIYWKFSSPKGYFNVLIYMHRYTPDTLNNILNNYLREFINKLSTRKEQMQHLENTGSASEKAQASKEIDTINKMLADCQHYQREILYPLASERIEMDLDDGVLVNYNLFGDAVEVINGVNDKKKKKKVKEFDWIDSSKIR
ncbi:MAG: BREX-1 system adenine-specific DNA-methyltransferase PglX [Balneolaceae bacterium]|nr:BREX-1 system adenine-specific DNA-methyltransferase PglX [Balneolaceae bacterium]